MSRFDFRKNYNLIYLHWGLNYLNDDEIKVFLRKAKNSLAVWNKKPGVMITRENISNDGK